MKKMVTFLVCLSAALVIDFLREGMFSRVYAQFHKPGPVQAGEAPSPNPKGIYPAPDPSIKSKSPDSVSGKPYPPPVSRPAAN